MTITITELKTHDVRFPTSRTLDGSDAVNVDPDYSAAYVILRTDQPGLEGHGLTFTNGRGNNVVCAGIEALGRHITGRTLESITTDLAGFWYAVAGDTQLRWLGPEKGVIHLATGALVNAVWDLYAKAEGKPVFFYNSFLRRRNRSSGGRGMERMRRCPFLLLMARGPAFNSAETAASEV